MAYDDGLVEALRHDLRRVDGITEREMFGGLAFFLHGNMICGVHSEGPIFRVGKANEASALAVAGARPMTFTGRTMGGFIEVSNDAFGRDGSRHHWLNLALRHARTLPPK